MIQIRTPKEIAEMREACRISAAALRVAREAVRPGVSTAHVDDEIKKFILSCGAKPSFLRYQGFPKSACISVNDEIIHGIPSYNRILKEGDIVSVDVGAFKNGYHGDNATTIPVGEVSDEAKKLLAVTEEALKRGVAAAVAGGRVGDIGHAVQSYVEENGFSVVRDYVGHGVGHHLHEEPEVPNYGKQGHGVRLVPGMTIAIEPMVNTGGWQVEKLDNDWTVVTKDGGLSAHFEYTVAVTDAGPVVLTAE